MDIQKLTASIERLAKKYANGKITDEQYIKQSQKLLTQSYEILINL